MTTTNTKIKYGIRTKILLIFTVFSVVALVLVSSIILGSFGVMNNTTTEESESALTTQIQTNMIASAEENAHTIGAKLQNAIKDVESMAYYATHLFNNPNYFGYYPSYNDTDLTNPDLDLSNDVEGYAPQTVSLKYSMYHLANTTYDLELGYDSANTSMKNLINMSANLDHIFKYTKAGNSDFGWIYMGFDLGLFRSYPWSTFDSDYDPRLRGWYDTDELKTKNDLLITSPYIDANGLGLMITVAKGVFYENNGTLIGIIAADLTIDTIKENILDISFLDDKGYAFLTDKNGLAVVHPDISEPEEGEDVTQSIRDAEPISNDLYNEILIESQGIGTYEKSEGIIYYLAYSEVENTNFILINVVPEADALASVGILQIEVDKATVGVRITLLIIILIAGAISVFLGTMIAGQITKPVKILTQSIQKLTSQDSVSTILNSGTDIVIDESLEAQDDEIGDLTRAFKGMLSAIKEDSKNK